MRTMLLQVLMLKKTLSAFLLLVQIKNRDHKQCPTCFYFQLSIDFIGNHFNRHKPQVLPSFYLPHILASGTETHVSIKGTSLQIFFVFNILQYALLSFKRVVPNFVRGLKLFEDLLRSVKRPIIYYFVHLFWSWLP